MTDPTLCAMPRGYLMDNLRSIRDGLNVYLVWRDGEEIGWVEDHTAYPRDRAVRPQDRLFMPYGRSKGYGPVFGSEDEAYEWLTGERRRLAHSVLGEDPERSPQPIVYGKPKRARKGKKP